MIKIGEIREVIPTGYFIKEVVGYRFTIVGFEGKDRCRIDWLSLPPSFALPNSELFSTSTILAHTKRAESYAVSQILSHYE